MVRFGRIVYLGSGTCYRTSVPQMAVYANPTFRPWLRCWSCSPWSLTVPSCLFRPDGSLVRMVTCARDAEGGNVGWGEVFPHHPISGSGERRKLPQRDPGRTRHPRPKMDFMHILGQKEATWKTIFGVFSDSGAPQTSRARETPPPIPPSRWACTCGRYSSSVEGKYDVIGTDCKCLAISYQVEPFCRS